MLAASRADKLRHTIERSAVTRRVVRRFVPGDTLDGVLDVVVALRDSDRYVSIDYLGENVTDAADAAPPCGRTCSFSMRWRGPTPRGMAPGRLRCP